VAAGALWVRGRFATDVLVSHSGIAFYPNAEPAAVAAWYHSRQVISRNHSYAVYVEWGGIKLVNAPRRWEHHRYGPLSFHQPWSKAG
jgi:hypothetical protein